MTEPHYSDGGLTLFHGKSEIVLTEFPDAHFDSVVCDPPYELGFMGKGWDGSGIAYDVPMWQEVLRVLKPGGHLLAFGGTRTFHRMATAIEDAGFEIRDSIAWLYGSGFPKSLDVSKAIDKRGGNSHLAAQIGGAIKAAREARGWSTSRADQHFCGGSTNWTWFEGRKGMCRPPTAETFARIVAEWPELAATAELVAEAEREVVGTERKADLKDHVFFGNAASPLGRAIGYGQYDLTVASTDAARVWDGWGTALKPAFEPIVVGRKPLSGTVAANVLEHGTGAVNIDGARTEGRWPTNVVLDPSQADELDRQAPRTGGSGPASGPTLTGESTSVARGKFSGVEATPYYGGDLAGASRFFPTFRYEAKAPGSERPDVDGVQHATVKPLDLMRWLVRLVTRPGGLVLDHFAGSGTTGEAALLEGMNVVLIEMEAEHLPLILQRVKKPLQQSLFEDILA